MVSKRGRSAVRGVAWAAVDKFGVTLLQFVINLVLARLLLPGDFGTIGMILIFVAVSQTLVDGGFGAALIQKIDASQRDYSTIFYWNLLFSLGLYLAIFLAAPCVARFFGMPILSDMLRILGVVIVVNSLALVQRTILRKSINFKTIAIVDILSSAVSAVVAICLAYNGFGAWSIVGMQLANALISVLLFWCFSRWRPSLTFSLESLKSLFSFGGYMLVASIMQDVCTHIQGVVIGRRFSATETGLYTQAKKMDEVASMTIPAIFCQVLYPLYAERQNDLEALRDMLRRNTQMIASIIFPLMILLIVVAEPLLLFLFGNQWVDAVPYFQILCIGGLFSALYNFNYYAVAAVGRSRALFYWGCYKWGMLIVLLVVGASISMLGVLIAMVISNLNIYITNALLAQRYVGYGLWRQVVDVLPVLGVALLCGGIAYIVFAIWGVNWVVSALIFTVLYILVGHLFRLDGFVYVLSFIVSYLRR